MLLSSCAVALLLKKRDFRTFLIVLSNTSEAAAAYSAAILANVSLSRLFDVGHGGRNRTVATDRRDQFNVTLGCTLTDVIDEINLTRCQLGEADGDGEKTLLGQFASGAEADEKKAESKFHR